MSRKARFLVALGLAVAIAGGPWSCKGDKTESWTKSLAELTGQAHPNKPARRVVLKAKKKIGVPLHPRPAGKKVSGRLPGGTTVTVLDTDKGGKWLLVRSDKGLAGWISRRYVKREEHKPHKPGTQPRAHGKGARIPSSSPWASPSACLAKLQEGRPLHPGTIRVGTWNLRWFPYGSLHRSERKRTNVDWMACVIAVSSVDALAIQEVVRNPEGKRAMRHLLDTLRRFTNSEWKAVFDDCPGRGRQHVGVMWNTARLKGRVVGRVDQLNPSPEGCGENLRPGMGVYFRSRKGGLDWHLVSVHFDSGTTRRDYENRLESLRSVSTAAQWVRRAVQDEDVMILGDFNTMGCELRGGCAPAVDWRVENASIDRIVSRSSPRFRSLSVVPACTEFYRGQGIVLDHMLVSSEMREAEGIRTAASQGLCAVSCSGMTDHDAMALRHLSDHCLVTVDLPDKDQD